MSITFRITETLGAPPARVFSALTDLEGASHWMPGFVRIDATDTAPLHVGSRWRETRRMLGHEASELFEVTEIEAPSRLGLRVDGTQGTSKRGEYRFAYSLAPDGPGTRVTLDGEIRGLSGVMELVGRLFVGSYRKACVKDLRALDAFLSAAPPEATERRSAGAATLPPPHAG